MGVGRLVFEPRWSRVNFLLEGPWFKSQCQHHLLHWRRFSVFVFFQKPSGLLHRQFTTSSVVFSLVWSWDECHMTWFTVARILLIENTYYALFLPHLKGKGIRFAWNTTVNAFLTVIRYCWSMVAPKQTQKVYLVYRSFVMVCNTDYGRPMKPFFIEIQNFWLGQTNRSNKPWGIWGISSLHFGTTSPLSMFSIIQPLFLQKN